MLDGDAERLLRSKNVVEFLMENCERIFAVFVCSALADELEGLKILKNMKC